MKLSIIVCVSNERKTIKKILKKINQLRLVSPWKKEIIIVDNCSTDGTLEAINEQKDDISLIVSESDEGIYYALNKGIKLANGEIIGFLNAAAICINPESCVTTSSVC